ncbi:MAG TPA: sodium:solute symporter, partial [Gammaproteobacteria bacterium]|nr:sodium:solute symporter [Gammaproteobacteria bacterium]
LQLLGGAWIIQTLPIVVIGLYTRWLHRWALAAGWAVGMGLSTWMVVSQQFKPTFPLHVGDWTLPGYADFYSAILNLVIAIVLTWLFRAARLPEAPDATVPADYEHDVA